MAKERAKLLIQHGTGRKYAYCEMLAKRVDMMVAYSDEDVQRLTERATEDAPTQEPEQDSGELVISKATKDELEAYAKAEFDVDLDKRKSVDSLREQVRELAGA